MPFRPSVTNIPFAPTTGKLGLTNPTQAALSDMYRQALRDIDDLIGPSTVVGTSANIADRLASLTASINTMQAAIAALQSGTTPTNTIDFTGANNAPWPAPFVQTSNSGGALASIQSNRGNMFLPAVATAFGALQGMGFNPTGGNDYTITVDIVYPAAGESFSRVFWRDVNGNNTLSCVFEVGSNFISVYKQNADFTQVNKGGQVLTFVPGDIIHVKVNVVGSQHNVKWWINAAPEPPAYQVPFTEATVPTGFIGVQSQSGTTAVARNHAYDNWLVVYGTTAPPPSLTDEEIQDIVGTMLTGGSQQRITVTYDDSSGKLNFARHFTVPKRTVTTTPYTLVVADVGTMVEMNLSSASTVIIPPFSTSGIPTESSLDLCRLGTGTVTVTAPGLTFRPRGDIRTIGPQNGAATLWQRGIDDWVMIGDLA